MYRDQKAELLESRAGKASDASEFHAVLRKLSKMKNYLVKIVTWPHVHDL